MDERAGPRHRHGERRAHVHAGQVARLGPAPAVDALVEEPDALHAASLDERLGHRACARKVCLEICSAEAIRPGEGGVPAFDRERCVHCGACLWSCTQRLDGTDEVNLAFRAGTGGLHSAEN